MKEHFLKDTSVKLPEEWQLDKHDKNLLKAVSENGLHYLSRLKDNTEYDFIGIRVTKKRLMKRVENLCKFFKDQLPKFKKMNASSAAGNLSCGNTKIDIKRKITKINVDRDGDGNIKYPIVVMPTLTILNLGIVDYERPNYHSEKNIFPIGWKSVREATSYKNVGSRA